MTYEKQESSLKTVHLATGSLLKEAIEDLEWVAGSGSASITIHRQPLSVSLSAYSTGSLEIKIQVPHTVALGCKSATVTWMFCFQSQSTLIFEL